MEVLHARAGQDSTCTEEVLVADSGGILVVDLDKAGDDNEETVLLVRRLDQLLAAVQVQLPVLEHRLYRPPFRFLQRVFTSPYTGDVTWPVPPPCSAFFNTLSRHRTLQTSHGLYHPRVDHVCRIAFPSGAPQALCGGEKCRVLKPYTRTAEAGSQDRNILKEAPQAQLF